MMLRKRFLILLYFSTGFVAADKTETRFVSFDLSRSGDSMEIAVNFAMPVLSIPLNREPGKPLVNVNPKTIVFSGLLLLAIALLAPVFQKRSDIHKRSIDHFSGPGDLASCIQQIICDAINENRKNAEDCNGFEQLKGPITGIVQILSHGSENRCDVSSKYFWKQDIINIALKILNLYDENPLKS